MSGLPDLDDFVAEATSFLDQRAERREVDTDEDVVWGKGEFNVSVFHALSEDDERALLRRGQDWIQMKAERGYHAIDWPTELGGLGLPTSYARAFGRVEREFVTPAGHETHGVTTRLVAPTVRAVGTPEQQAELVPTFLTADRAVLPAVLRARRRLRPRDAVVPGRARRRRVGRQRPEGVELGRPVLGQWGELIARHDPDVVKHKGLTAFVIPMDLPGIDDPADQADERRVVVQRGVLRRRARARLDASRPGRRGLEGRPDDARASSATTPTAPAAAAGSAGPGASSSARPGRWAWPAIRSCASASSRCTRASGSSSFVARRAADIRRAGAAGRAGGLARQAALDRTA